MLSTGGKPLLMDRYGHLYPSDNERVQDALDAAFETGLVASNVPKIEAAADQMQTTA